jgi:hypothetical protein
MGHQSRYRSLEESLPGRKAVSNIAYPEHVTTGTRGHKGSLRSNLGIGPHIVSWFFERRLRATYHWTSSLIAGEPKGSEKGITKPPQSQRSSS